MCTMTLKISLTVAPKNMKSFGVNLTNHVWDLDAENYKILMKEIKEECKELFALMRQ